MKRLFTGVRDWYGRNERPISSLSLFVGFVFEWFALERIDQFWENLWVAAHFFIIAGLIIMVNFEENEAFDHRDASRLHFWYLTFLQGFFGGMLSTFLVFYFRGATIAVSWPFLLLLAGAFIANESFKKHYSRLLFQLSLFYLSLLAFAIYIVPVFYHRIGTDIFLISGLISLGTLSFFVIGIGFFAKKKFKESGKMLALSVFGIYFISNILYFLNVIPPIPLSLKDAGVYHALYHDVSGKYVMKTEDKAAQSFFSFAQDVHLVPGGQLYAFTSIFSPTSFSTRIIHEWQQYDKSTGAWITKANIELSAVGGRDIGYRIYSVKNNVVPGEWRVNVETEQGQIIGRLRFNVFEANNEPALKTVTK